MPHKLSDVYAANITAGAAVLTAVALIITALSVLLPTLRATRKTSTQVNAVHTIVNQRFTDQQRHIIALREQLLRLGQEPVIDQSLPVTGQADAERFGISLTEGVEKGPDA